MASRIGRLFEVDRLGPDIANAAAEGFTRATLSPHRAIQDGYECATQLKEALESTAPAGAVQRRELRLRLAGIIEAILDLAPQDSPLPLSDAEKASLRVLIGELTRQPQNLQELRRELDSGIRILYAKQGIPRQVNEVVLGALAPAKHEITGRPPRRLEQARDALLNLKTKITYYALSRDDLRRDAGQLIATLERIEEMPHNKRIWEIPQEARDEIALLRPILERLIADGPLPEKQEVIPLLRNLYDILDEHIYEKSGMTTRVRDDVLQTQRKLLIDGTMQAVDFVRGRNPEVGPIVIAQDPPPKTLMDYLAGMQEHLSGYLKQGGRELFSRDTAQLMSGALLVALEGARDSIKGQENFDPTYVNLEKLITKVKNLTEDNGATLTQLYNVVGESIQQLNEVPIYINHLVRIPQLGMSSSSGNNAEVPFASKIASMKRTLNPNADNRAKGVEHWKEQANLEKDKFIKNTKNFAILKIIYERFCGLEADQQRYLDIIHSQELSADNLVEEGIDSDAILRDALFDGLEEVENLSSIKKRIARMAYPIISYIVNNFVQNLGTSYVDETFHYIEASRLLHRGQRNEGGQEAERGEEEETVRFNSLKNSLIENFTRYLISSNGAYARVAANPIPNNTLPNMHQKELAKEEVYDGVTPEDLYGSLATFIIDKCIDNPILKILLSFFISGSVVEGIIDESVGSIMDENGYTHALNTVLVDLLKEILDKVKENEKAGKKNPLPTYQDRDSKKNKKKMKALVKNLFEVLKKNNCETQDELKALLQDPSLAQKLTKMGEDLFMEDVVESVADVLTLAIQELVTDEQLFKLVADFTKAINNVYEKGHKYTRQEVRDKEIELDQLTNQLITVSISTAVKSKFDFMGGGEQIETNKEIELLREETQTLVDSATQDLATIEGSILVPNPDHLADLALLTQIRTTAEKTLEYLKKCNTDRFTDLAKQLGSHNIDKLERIFIAADKNITRFSENIEKMLQAQQRIEMRNRLNDPVDGILQIVHDIQVRFGEGGGHNPDEIETAKEQIDTLEKHLTEAEGIMGDRNLAPLRNLLKPLAKSLIALQNNAKIIAFYENLRVPRIENDANGRPLPWTLQQIMEERRAHTRCPSALKEQIERFKREVRNVPFNDPTIPGRLCEQLDEIQNSVFSNPIDAAYRTFCQIAEEAQRTALEELDEQKAAIGRNCNQIEQGLNGLEIMDANYIEGQRQIIRDALPQAQRGLEEIRCSYLHKELIVAEKKASDLFREIEQKTEELQAMPVEQQETREAQIRTELTQKIKEVGSALATLMTDDHLLVAFHFNGAIGEAANLEQADRQVLAEKLHLFNEQWQNGLPDEVSLEEAKQHMKQLRKLLIKLKRAQAGDHNIFNPIPYKNIQISDMHGFRDMITGIAINRVKERAHGLIDVVTSEGFIRYGLLLRVSLIPYLEYNKALPKPRSKWPWS